MTQKDNYVRAHHRILLYHFLFWEQWLLTRTVRNERTTCTIQYCLGVHDELSFYAGDVYFSTNIAHSGNYDVLARRTEFSTLLPFTSYLKTLLVPTLFAWETSGGVLHRNYIYVFSNAQHYYLVAEPYEHDHPSGLLHTFVPSLWAVLPTQVFFRSAIALCLSRDAVIVTLSSGPGAGWVVDNGSTGTVVLLRFL